MSYERNKIKYFLERNSLIQIYSKTTSSVYYYFKYCSVRYSDHLTPSRIRTQQIQVIRTSRRVMILLPGETEYRRFNEKTGFYFLRKLLRSDTTRKGAGEKQYQKFMKYKNRCKEKRKIRKELSSMKGHNLKTLNMNPTGIGCKLPI